ncbi:MAG: hypothetical protein AAF517_02065 [Planctomycetota bacterium]
MGGSLKSWWVRCLVVLVVGAVGFLTWMKIDVNLPDDANLVEIANWAIESNRDALARFRSAMKQPDFQLPKDEGGMQRKSEARAEFADENDDPRQQPRVDPRDDWHIATLGDPSLELHLPSDATRK